jgi:dihydropteroate synthase
MGVVNVTPDSFSDGGVFFKRDAAVVHAQQLIAEGADIVDIGGESSRPGSEPVSEEEELRRVIPVIEALAPTINVPISIDTYTPAVAEAALNAGARIINDITGLRNPEMIRVAAEHNATVVLMHMQGEPKTMQHKPQYIDVVADIISFFEERIEAARTQGVEKIIVDPGIGFGKTLEQNLEILHRLNEFTKLGYPVLVGASRKSFIGTVTGAEVGDRLPGTLAAHMMAVLNGATMLRVHDVAECRQALQVMQAIQYGKE